jgi:hypothetical protein
MINVRTGTITGQRRGETGGPSPIIPWFLLKLWYFGSVFFFVAVFDFGEWRSEA